MGILGLSKWAADNSPGCIREKPLKEYFGQKIAIDASMCLYQFLIAVRQDGQQLQNEDGEATSHLSGMFYRTIRMMENGIKPVFVFDGKPPELKSDELDKRTERRAEAEKQLEAAKENADAVAVEKFSRRLVKVTKQHNEDARRLLKLMGVPVVEAPCEAEAQCAELVKTGKVFATATEDMDALTFGSTVLLRNMFSKTQGNQTQNVKEFNLEKLLRDVGMTMEQFIDLCILLGCDYCPTIRGIGPKKAHELIREHKTIENVLKKLDAKKYPPPEGWKFAAARKLFLGPEITKGDEVQLAWTAPDEEGILQFMCQEKNFTEDRIRNGLVRLQKSRQQGTQGRIDTFFTRVGVKTTEPSALKRKAEDAKKGGASGVKIGGTPKSGKRAAGPPAKRAK